MDYLRLQPNVEFIWGNHDVSRLGASLGHEALICTVLRISLRYRQLSQLDEGYSVPLTPLEHLAQTVYANDPAEHFMPKKDGFAAQRPGGQDAEGPPPSCSSNLKDRSSSAIRNGVWIIGDCCTASTISTAISKSTAGLMRSAIDICQRLIPKTLMCCQLLKRVACRD